MFGSQQSNNTLREAIMRKRNATPAEPANNTRGQRTSCSTLRQVGCDRQGLQTWQLEVGHLSRALMLHDKERNASGAAIQYKGVLVDATMGFGKTLAGWAVAANSAVYTTQPNEVQTVLMLGDKMQVDNWGDEAHKAVRLFRMHETGGTASSLSNAARDIFLKGLPHKKAVITQGVSRVPIGNEGATVVDRTLVQQYAGNHDGKPTAVRLWYSGDIGPGDRESSYADIKGSAEAFYNQLYEKQDAVLDKLRSLGDAGRAAAGRLQKAVPIIRKGSYANWNAYIDVMYKLARPVNLQKPTAPGYGAVYRLNGLSLLTKVPGTNAPKIRLRQGDLVRFFITNGVRGASTKKYCTPYMHVVYENAEKDELKVTSLLQGNDELCNLVDTLGYALFRKIFALDTANILRPERPLSVQVKLVDQKGMGGGDSEKLFDLQSSCVESIGKKFGDSVKLHELCTWWMRHGQLDKPSWWLEPGKPGYRASRTWPKGSKTPYQGGAARGELSPLASTVIIGMTHGDFQKLVQRAKIPKAFQSTVIVLDEAHQRKSEEAIAKAVEYGAKPVGLTATPYDKASDLYRLFAKLGGNSRSMKAADDKTKLQAEDVPKLMKRHGVLLYRMDATTGKHNNIMPTMYPERHNQRGLLNLKQLVLNHRGNTANVSPNGNAARRVELVSSSLLKCTKKGCSVDTQKYPFPKAKPMSNKQRANAARVTTGSASARAGYRTTHSRSSGSRSTGSRSTGSRSTGSRSTGSRSTGSRSTGSRSSGSRSNGSRSYHSPKGKRKTMSDRDGFPELVQKLGKLTPSNKEFLANKYNKAMKGKANNSNEIKEATDKVKAQFKAYKKKQEENKKANEQQQGLLNLLLATKKKGKK